MRMMHRIGYLIAMLFIFPVYMTVTVISIIPAAIFVLLKWIFTGKGSNDDVGEFLEYITRIMYFIDDKIHP